MSTVTASRADLALQFHALADEWRTATRFLSSPSAATEHASYRAIIELGPEVVPLILGELALRPEPWFAALRELTTEDPAATAERGRPQVTAESWLAWGRARGLV